MWVIRGGPLTGYHVEKEGEVNAYTFWNMWDAIFKRNSLNAGGK